jgi:hypothetical protein
LPERDSHLFFQFFFALVSHQIGDDGHIVGMCLDSVLSLLASQLFAHPTSNQSLQVIPWYHLLHLAVQHILEHLVQDRAYDSEVNLLAVRVFNHAIRKPL